MPTHGSLFDGFGGLRRGLEDAGFITQWTLDILNGQDITREKPEHYAKVDLISGGPPCLHTSQAAAFNKRRSLESLWPEMLRFVSHIKPRWVLVEQPPGGWQIIAQASYELQRLGYGCAGRIIDSQHWVPQQRARWFVVARLGITGVELWHHLYPDGERGSSRHSQQFSAKAEGAHYKVSRTGALTRRSTTPPRRIFTGSCTLCMRGGIFAGVQERRAALMGAGNAVTQVLAEWLGERIKHVDRLLREGRPDARNFSAVRDSD